MNFPKTRLGNIADFNNGVNFNQTSYKQGEISKIAFWELVKFRYPTHQIAFCTEAALETLTFKGSEQV